jgi:lysozyme family protein
MVDFDTCFDRLLGNEGGYCNNPNDPGGETNWGICKRSYPTVNIAMLTREGAKAIYRRDFWDAGGMDQFDGAVSFQLFDAAVNHGIETALRMLQSAVGVAADGHIGPVTIAAVKQLLPAAVIMRFLSARAKFYTSLSTWPTFGRGWTNRVANNLNLAAEDIGEQ